MPGLDEPDKHVGYEDVFTKIDICRARTTLPSASAPTTSIKSWVYACGDGHLAGTGPAKTNNKEIDRSVF